MNQAARYEPKPSCRQSWCADIPFLLAQSSRVARSHLWIGIWLRSYRVADRGCELLAAILALVDTRPRALALHLGSVVDRTAVWTDRTIGPTCRLEMPAGDFFV